MFVGLCPKLPVIASQCAHWSWQSPGPMEAGTITTENRRDSYFMGAFRYISPLSKGIATPVCGLVRNDSVNSPNNNLHRIIFYSDSSFPLYHPTGSGRSVPMPPHSQCGSARPGIFPVHPPEAAPAWQSGLPGSVHRRISRKYCSATAFPGSRPPGS